MRAVLFVLTLAPGLALAQAAGPAPDAAADSVVAAAAARAVDAVAAADLLRRSAPPPESSVRVRQALEAAARPVVYAFGSGLRVTLPPGWSGPALEAAPEPGLTTYAFENTAPGHPLRGAVLRLERVEGMNEVMRERWTRGQTQYGYHGTAPVGPLASSLGGLAAEVAGSGRAGGVVFTHRADGWWAVHATAPAAVWQARRAEVLAVLAGVSLPPSR